MKFVSLLKNSFVNYPNQIAAVVFTAGCNFRCWYCHNANLISYQPNLETVSEEEVLNFLKKRKGLLDGLVVTGGEPTLHPDLEAFLGKVKTLGFLVKLDTNGSNPAVLQNLLSKKLLDFVAIDIKTSLAHYEALIGTKINTNNIKKSVKLLLHSNISYEFRTTFSPDVTLQDIESIGKLIKGAKQYAIQKYNPQPNAKILGVHSLSDFQSALTIAKKYVKNSILRSLD